jgi:DHA2 family multidrug resistance protein
VVAGLWLMSFDLNTPMELLALNSAIQGISVGTVWVPLTIATFNTLEGRQLPEAMAVFHLMRNIGSSFFIALSVTEILRTQAQNYSRLGEMISPFNERLRLPWVMGNWSVETVPDLARLAKEINRQAAMIGYLNAFTLYTVTSALAVLLVLLVPRIRPRKA